MLEKDRMTEGGATMQSSCRLVLLPGPKKIWGPTVDDRALLSDDENSQQEILEDESLKQRGGRSLAIIGRGGCVH